MDTPMKAPGIAEPRPAATGAKTPNRTNKRPYTIPAINRSRGAPLEHIIAFDGPARKPGRVEVTSVGPVDNEGGRSRS